MLIKIVQNGIESEWFQLTKKAHRELIKTKPEAAIVHIEDVYPESPDAGRVIRLDFRLFTVLTREFKLEDLKQEKRDERHVEKLRLEARPANAPELASKTLDEQYIRQEIKDLLKSLEKTMPGVRERIFGAMQRLPLPEWGPVNPPHRRNAIPQGDADRV